MGVNKIVLMTHYQYENDLELAAALNGVDVIVSKTGFKVGIGVGNGDRLAVFDDVCEGELNGGT